LPSRRQRSYRKPLSQHSEDVSNVSMRQSLAATVIEQHDGHNDKSLDIGHEQNSFTWSAE
jgi:hypothetical protein